MNIFLYLIFFLSGAAALIFETIWFRLAGLMFGNSVWSASLILGGFMAGLAMGNYLATRYGGRMASPVRVYAWLEVAIGVTGMCLVMLFPLFERILIPVFRPFLDTPLLLNLLRLSGAFFLILVPTSAMGATLPVLVKAICRSDQSFGRVLGRLYGMNTIGAVAGALLGELLLIQAFGLRGAGLTAVLLNLTAAFCAYLLSRSPLVGGRAVEEVQFREAGLPARGRRIMAAAFLAGCIMLCLEVVWFRFLLLTLSGTSLVFSVMLSVVLAGIGLGGLIASWWFRYGGTVHHSVRTVACICGILVAASYRWFSPVYQAVQNLDVSSRLISIPEFALLALFLMLPVSIASGIVFTLLGQALRQEIPSETGAAGMLTLSNTVGAMIGSFLAGFILLPHMGMERSFFILAAGYGIAALIMPAPAGLSGKQRLVSYIAGAGMAMTLVLFPFGLMEDAYFKIVSIRDEKRIAVREALTETIFYFRRDMIDQPLYYRLVTNGHSMSSTGLSAKRYMKLYVYLPVALNPDIRSALLISYGVGSTAKALTDTRSLHSIDVVDISRDILEMSSFVYSDPAEHPLKDPRVKVHIEDGRFFLNYTEQQYDLITSEPPPPKNAGIVNLYTKEYFELIMSRLNDGGMTTYWLPVHSLYEDETKSIIKAFCNVFHDCTLWSGSGLDWMLVGTRNARGPVSESHFIRQWNDPKVGPEMRTLGLETPGQVGALFMADSQDLEVLTEGAQPLSDNYPYRLTSRTKKDPTEFSQLYHDWMDPHNTIGRFQKSSFVKRMWPEIIISESYAYFPYQRMLTDILAPAYRQKDFYEWDDLYAVLSQTPLKTLPLWMVGTSQRDIEIIGMHKDEEKHLPEFEFLSAIDRVSERDYREALNHFERYFAIAGKDSARQKYPFYLMTLCLAGEKNRAEKAAAAAGPLLGDHESSRMYWEWLDRTCGVTYRSPK